MTDENWLREQLSLKNITITTAKACEWFERVGIKVDSNIGVKESREQAFKEIFT